MSPHFWMRIGTKKCHEEIFKRGGKSRVRLSLVDAAGMIRVDRRAMTIPILTFVFFAFAIVTVDVTGSIARM